MENEIEMSIYQILGISPKIIGFSIYHAITKHMLDIISVAIFENLDNQIAPTKCTSTVVQAQQRISTL